MIELIDTTSLFLHVLSAVGIIGAGLVQALAGLRLRSATTRDRIADWGRLTSQANRILAVAAAVSLTTGGHLAGAVWTTDEISGFSYPFITLGAVGLVVLGLFAAVIGRGRLTRLLDGAEADEVPIAQLVEMARTPRLWGPVHAMIGIAVGMVALMVYKPNWAVGVVLLAVTTAGGWAIGMSLGTTTSHAKSG